MMKYSKTPLLLLKVLIDTRKNFSENCGQFWRALSKVDQICDSLICYEEVQSRRLGQLAWS
jgi:hypothetical protein